MFKINVADAPEAVTDLSVVAAGPSSLKVTWKAGKDQQRPHHLVRLGIQGRRGQTAWLPALLPESIVATKSYTIEGLAPGEYEVQVTATNMLGDSEPAMESGRTGAGARHGDTDRGRGRDHT